MDGCLQGHGRLLERIRHFKVLVCVPQCSESQHFPYFLFFFIQHDDVEFEILANYLNLCILPPRDEKQPSLYSARCVQFAHEKPSDLITAWCKQLIKVVKRQPTKAKVSSHSNNKRISVIFILNKHKLPIGYRAIKEAGQLEVK